MSETAPRSNPFGEALNDFDSRKEEHAAKAWTEELQGEAGKTDFSDEARQRLEDLKAYHEHMEQLSNETRSDYDRGLDRLESGEEESTAYGREWDDAIAENEHRTAIKMNEEFDAAEAIRLRDEKIQGNVVTRQADRVTDEISALRSKDSLSDEEKARLSDLEERLQDLLVRYSNEDNFDPEISDYLLNKGTNGLTSETVPSVPGDVVPPVPGDVIPPVPGDVVPPVPGDTVPPVPGDVVPPVPADVEPPRLSRAERLRRAGRHPFATLKAIYDVVRENLPERIDNISNEERDRRGRRTRRALGAIAVIGVGTALFLGAAGDSSNHHETPRSTPSVSAPAETGTGHGPEDRGGRDGHEALTPPAATELPSADGAAYPWNWAEKAVGADKAEGWLHDLSDKAAAAGYKVEWHGSGTHEWVKLTTPDGSKTTSRTNEVIDMLRPFAS